MNSSKIGTDKTTHELYKNALCIESTKPLRAKKKLQKVLNLLKPFLKSKYINGRYGKGIKADYSDVVVEIGNIYKFLNRNDTAVKFYKRILTNNTEYVNNWGMGAIYNNIGAYMSTNNGSDRIPWYVKSCKFYFNDIPHKNLMNIYKDEIKHKNDKFTLKYLKQKIELNNIYIIRNKNNEAKYYIRIINLSIRIIKCFDDLESQEKWIAAHVSSNINPLYYNYKTGNNNFKQFNHGKSVKNNKCTIINVFKLIKCSLKFLVSHIIKSPNQTLFQYTGISTLKSICNVNKYSNDKNYKFHLRLYNSEYMNDPLEGKELLKQIINNKNSNETTKNLMNTIYSNTKNKFKNLISLNPSRVYIASLSYVDPGNDNSMSLWNSYSDDHKGLALRLDVKASRNSNEYNDNGFTSNISVNNKSFNEDKIPLHLYEVSYGIENLNKPNILNELEFEKNFYNKQINSKGIKKHKYFMKKLSKKLMTITRRIKDIKFINTLISIINNIKPNILINNDRLINVIKLSLDRIRFLFKSGVYQYEREYRIMEELPPNYYKNIYYDRGNEKLYVNLENNSKRVKDNVTANLTQIIFGNRCKSYYWVPIVKKQLPGVKIFKSNIKYR